MSAVRRQASGSSRSGTPASLSVRQALAGDHAPLTFFFDTVLRKDYFLKRGQLADILTGGHHRVFVAEIDAVLVGVAIVSGPSRLINALVHPAYRGLGIGAALVQASGAREVRAKLDMSSGDPRAFYRRLGFRGTGRRNEKGNIELMRRAAAGAGESTPPADASHQDGTKEKHDESACTD